MEEKSQEQLFWDHYNEYYKSKPNKRPWNEKQLTEIANEITTVGQISVTKTRRQYYLLKTYDVIIENDKKSVVKKVKTQNGTLTYIVPEEEVYNRLLEIHISCGHGSRDKMTSIVKQNFMIARPCIEMFLRSCKSCQTKKNKNTSKIVKKAITSNNFMSRGQVGLIDFQSIADGEYKWLLNYQDHATKYICLRPLRSKQVTEVAAELLKIFLQFGAPSILQSDNGREFSNMIIEELKCLCPEFIVHGRPRHPQNHRSIEHANLDVENLLRAWMSDNDSTAWSIGCNYVQWQKNNTLHRVIGRSPYKAVFGSESKLGLKSTKFQLRKTPKIKTNKHVNEFKNKHI